MIQNRRSESGLRSVSHGAVRSPPVPASALSVGTLPPRLRHHDLVSRFQRLADLDEQVATSLQPVLIVLIEGEFRVLELSVPRQETAAEFSRQRQFV
jgi:hypothetical protein